MVYTNLKNAALGLRKEGLSYAEIKEKVPVSKATLSKWFREIKLSPVQKSRLKQKRTEGARRASEKKAEQTLKSIQEIKSKSSREIRKISKRELWLMGVMLYWKNGNKNDLKKGVHFTSADPDQIKMFLNWLYEIGGLKDEELTFDIFLTGTGAPDKAINFWSKITGFSEDSFNHIYRHKKRHRKSKRQIQKNSENGLLRVRVRASSMLARQISGWIEGLKEVAKL
ncbi:MAG: hypothetical protein A3I92_00560 [Candidatus Yanofskybacteria bacterium RIFCSPLOWO2_02_FULL_43_10b]|uniref:Uncharacterized protein n=1 Tax=Candidatus Yanofskybacteria bacterium RIFCSPLOWO2_02_FULL_43_10b TaxID=1802704 RepID=A0A1F8H1V7_9BACT|nr:MAG: hypothetical protein A3I92_00560 [Candidatus Yanofskybacteria bacterium RIFCSPLOWO2_02_FULL_43_10b]